jgi:hypothetical protein
MKGQAESIIPSDASTFQCPGCGFSVEARGKLCAICQDKQDARGPQGSADLRPMHSKVAPKDGPPERDPDAEDFEEADEEEEP